MLSNDERRTLGKMQAVLAESDPELARLFATGDTTRLFRIRCGYLVWAVGAMASLLTLVMLAFGVATGAFLGATIVLGAFVCQLWWPHPGRTHARRNTQWPGGGM